MNNYANHEGTEITEVNDLYNTDFATFVKSDVKNPADSHTAKAVTDTKNALKEKFPAIGQDSGKAIYDTLSEILNWDNLQNPDTKINKVITFILIKKYKPKIEDDSVKSSNICDATNTALKYGASLVSDIDKRKNRFGRIARHRSYARKSAARLAPHTRTKRRSFKRSKRPSSLSKEATFFIKQRSAVGVATSNKARKRSYIRSSSPKVTSSPESGLSKLRRRSIRRVRRFASKVPLAVS